jgi:Zn-finger nucleic acid-binding protein
METFEIGRESPGSTVLVCKKCKTHVRAGAGWSLFCPTCLGVWPKEEIIESVMSCVHCDQPLVIHQAEDNHVYGRCDTENCGDCYSMQDLCLVRLPQKIGVTLQTVSTTEELIAFIDTISDEGDLTLKTGEFRKKSKELARDDKEHWKVLKVLLGKMDKQFKHPSCRLLKATTDTMLKHTAWTWNC